MMTGLVGAVAVWLGASVALILWSVGLWLWRHDSEKREAAHHREQMQHLILSLELYKADVFRDDLGAVLACTAIRDCLGQYGAQFNATQLRVAYNRLRREGVDLPGSIDLSTPQGDAQHYNFGLMFELTVAGGTSYQEIHDALREQADKQMTRWVDNHIHLTTMDA